MATTGLAAYLYFVLRAVMYSLSIHSHIGHSKEALIWARYGGFPPKMNTKRKMARDGHHRFPVMS